MLKKYFHNRDMPFWIISFSILIGLTLPVLIQDGMFMDAVLYTSVSHNLSMGIGTFWFPQFSLHNIARLPSFHEQPPLVFGIQALFFTIFGGSMVVERFYTFITMLITAIVIVLLWKEIFRDDDTLKRSGWLAIILWISIPVCFWSYSNNMHENTMGIFTLCSALFIVKAFRSLKTSVPFCILSGIFILLATMSKGLPGFFPIAIPFLYWLTTKGTSFSRSILYTAIIILVPFIIYTILFLIPESRESLSVYLFKRVLHRISDAPTVDNRFYILFRLFLELLPQILLVIIIATVAGLKKFRIFSSKKNNQLSVFFILAGLSASLPLMLTLVQKRFYFVPALPFFAIGLAIPVASFIGNLIEKIDTKSRRYSIFFLLSIFLFLSTVTYSVMQKGKTGREKEILHDVYSIGKVVPKYSAISIPVEMWNDWGLQCYLIRYFNISLDPYKRNTFFMTDKSMKTDTLSGYKKINIGTVKYELYKRQ